MSVAVRFTARLIALAALLLAAVPAGAQTVKEPESGHRYPAVVEATKKLPKEKGAAPKSDS